MTEMADRKMAAVVDLCDDSDDASDGANNYNHDIIELDLQEDPDPASVPSVASRRVVSLLDDDDDGSMTASAGDASRAHRRSRIRNHLNGKSSPARKYLKDAASASAFKHSAAISARKRKRPKDPPSFSANNNGANNKDSEIQIIQYVKPPPPPLTPLMQIYEVFPDVDSAHATLLLQQNGGNIGNVLSALADATSYPKVKQKPTPAAAAVAVLGRGAIAARAEGGRGLAVFQRATSLASPKYDYLSLSSFEPTQVYKTEAADQLLEEFPFLSKPGVIRMLHRANFHYSIVRELVVTALLGKNDATAATTANNSNNEEQEEDQYQALKRVLTNKHNLQPDQLRRLGAHNTVKRLRRRHLLQPLSITDPMLDQEISYTKAKLSQWMDTVEQRLERKRARKQSQLAGTAVECSCCFDQVAMDEMVACRDEGHLFCVDCLKRYAESQIFGSGNLGTDKKTGKPALELACCHAGDGKEGQCTSYFTCEHLQKALPFKTLEKYNELQFKTQVERAGLQQDLVYVVVRVCVCVLRNNLTLTTFVLFRLVTTTTTTTTAPVPTATFKPICLPLK
jgi:hypothetical protein